MDLIQFLQNYLDAPSTSDYLRGQRDLARQILKMLEGPVTHQVKIGDLVTYKHYPVHWKVTDLHQDLAVIKWSHYTRVVPIKEVRLVDTGSGQTIPDKSDS